MSGNGAKSLTLPGKEGARLNRFKFKKLQDRVASANIDVIHRPQLTQRTPETGEHSSFFLDRLYFLQESNLSLPFRTFSNKIVDCVQSLPLLLYHKSRVLDALCEGLRTPHNESTSALLNLLALLPKDLGPEITAQDLCQALDAVAYQTTPETQQQQQVQEPVSGKRISNGKRKGKSSITAQGQAMQDTAFLEEVFMAVGNLLKNTRRYLLPKDMDQILQSFSQFLCNSRPYIRMFGARALAPHIRRLSDQEFVQALEILWSCRPSHGPPAERYQDGVAQFVMECVKFLQKHFHAKASFILSSAAHLAFLGDEDSGDKSSWWLKVLLQALPELWGWTRSSTELTLILETLHDTGLHAPGPLSQVLKALLEVNGGKHLACGGGEKAQSLFGEMTLELLATACRPSPEGSLSLHAGPIGDLLCATLLRWCGEQSIYESLTERLLAAAVLSPENCISIAQLLSRCFRVKETHVSTTGKKPSAAALQHRTVVLLPQIIRHYQTSFLPFSQELGCQLLTSQSENKDDLVISYFMHLLRGSVDFSNPQECVAFPLLSLPPPVFRMCVETLQGLVQDFVTSKQAPNADSLRRGWACGRLLRFSRLEPDIGWIDVAPGNCLESIVQACNDLGVEHRELGLLFASETIRLHCRAAKSAALLLDGIFPLACYLAETYSSLPCTLIACVEVLEKCKGEHKSYFTVEEQHRWIHRLSTPVLCDVDGLCCELCSAAGDAVMSANCFNTPCHSVRLASLMLLNLFPSSEYLGVDMEDKRRGDAVNCEIVPLALEGESAPHHVDCIRSKAAISERMAFLVVNGRVPTIYQQLLVDVLMGMMYTKLAPVWNACAKSLQHVAASQGSLFWQKSWPRIEDLVLSSLTKREARNSEAVTQEEVSGDNEDAEMEESGKGGSQDAEGQKGDEDDSSISSILHFVSKEKSWARPCVDPLTFLKKLLEVLLEVFKVANEHQKEVVSLYERFIQHEYGSRQVFGTQLSEVEDTNRAFQMSLRETPQVRQKLLLFLQLFSRFSDLKKVHRSRVLRETLEGLLWKADVELQQAALKTLLRFKFKWLNPYHEQLSELIQEQTFRRTLVNLDLEREEYVAEHRDKLSRIIVSILYGKMLTRTATRQAHTFSKKSAATTRHNVVFSFLRGLRPEHFQPFLARLLSPFYPLRKHTQLIKPGNVDCLDDELRSYVYSQAQTLRRTVLHSSMSLLLDCCKQMGATLSGFNPFIMEVVLAVLEAEETARGGAREDAPASLQKMVGRLQLRPLCWKTMTALLSPWAHVQDLGGLQESRGWALLSRCTAFMETLSQDLAQDASGNLSALMELALTMTKERDFFSALMLRPRILLNCMDCLSSKNVSTEVSSGALSLVERWLEILHEPLSFAGLEDSDRVQPPLTFEEAFIMAGGPIHAIQQIFVFLKSPKSQKVMTKRRGGLPQFFRRLLNVCCALSKYVEDPEQASHLVTLLLPFASKPHILGDEGMVTVLCTVDSLIPSLPDFFVPEPVDGGLQGATSLQLDSWSHFRTLSQLVFELNLELSTRLLLTQVLHRFCDRTRQLNTDTEDLEALVEGQHPLCDQPDSLLRPGVMSAFLVTFNSCSSMEIGEMDFQLRTRCYLFMNRLLQKITKPSAHLGLVPSKHSSGGVSKPQFSSIDEAQDFQRQQKLSQKQARKRQQSGHGLELDAPSAESLLQIKAMLPSGGHLVAALVLFSSQCMRDLGSSEYGLRTSAVTSLEVLLKALQTLLSPSTSVLHEEEKKALSRDVLLGCIFRAIKHAVTIRQSQKRKEYVVSLSQLACSFPEEFPELRKLSNPEDSALDVFHNLVHLQPHRQAKGLMQIKRAIEEGDLGEERILHDIFLPLVNHLVLLEPEDTERRFGKPKRGSRAPSDGPSHILENALQVLGAISSKLSWKKYQSLMMRIMRAIPEAGRRAKVLVRALCAVVDNFHFTLTSSTSKPDISQIPMTSYRPREDQVLGRSSDILSSTGLRSQQDSDEMESDTEREGKGGPSGVASEDYHMDVDAGTEDGLMSEEEEEDGEEKDQQRDGVRKEEGETPLLSMDSWVTFSNKVVLALSGRIIPMLYRILGEEKSEESIVRTHVAKAIVRVIKLLPEEHWEVQFPRLLQEICNRLRSRDPEIREASRSTLISVSKFMGASFLDHILSVLSSTLHSGYMIHVRGHALHGVLTALESTSQVGDLDGCMSRLMDLLLEDLLGEASQQRNVDAIKGSVLEARSTKAYESVELLARLVLFNPNIHLLMDPIMQRMVDTLSEERFKILRDVLERVAVGLRKNRMAEVHDVLVYSYASISRAVQGLQDFRISERGQASRSYTVGSQLRRDGASTSLIDKFHGVPLKDLKERQSMDTIEVLRPPPRKGAMQSESYDALFSSTSSSRLYHARHSPIVLDFCVRLMQHAIKSQVIQSVEKKSLLDPFVGLLSKAMKLDHSETVRSSLKALCILMKQQLPSIATHSRGIVDRCFKIIVKSAKYGSETVQSAFKLVESVLRLQKNIKLKQGQYELLIGHIEMGLGEFKQRAAALDLFESVISRKVMLPQVYDLLKKVGDIMVRSELQGVREKAGLVYCKFMLEYPLAENRLDQHLEFLLGNLAYRKESGRTSVLHALRFVVDKFPVPILSQRTELLFLPLVAQMVSDAEESCRQLCAQILQKLFGRIEASQLQIVMQCINTWLQAGLSEDPTSGSSGSESLEKSKSLQRAAAQLAGLLVQELGERSTMELSLFTETLPLLLSVLERGTEEDNRVHSLTRVQELNLHSRRAEVRREMERKLTSADQLAVQSDSDDGEGGAKSSAAFLLEEEEQQVGSQVEGLLKKQDWQSCYQTLVFFEKAFRHGALRPLHPDLEILWDLVFELLEHRHFWVRLTSMRNLGALFAAVSAVRAQQQPGEEASPSSGGEKRGKKTKRAKRSAKESQEQEVARRIMQKLLNNGASLLYRLIAQFESQHLNDEMALQVIKNTTFVGKELSLRFPPHTDVEALEESEQDAVRAIRKTLRRLGYFAQVLDSDLAKMSILRLFAALTMQIGAKRMPPMLFPVLQSIYKIINNPSLPVQVTALAQEVADAVQEIVGADLFLQVYSEVREQVSSLRRKRREERTAAAVASSQANANRKIKKHRKSRARAAQKTKKYAEERRGPEEERLRLAPLKRRKILEGED